MENQHTYLAYGSNLNEKDWKRFCERNGFSVDLLRYKGRVRLPDYQLVFDRYSNSRRGGVLNIKRAVGHYVDAIAFSTDDQGIEALRLKEGHPFAYVETHVTALQEDGSELDALTYIVPEADTHNFVAPTGEYYEICKEGYEAFSLCKNNLTLAANNKETQCLDALFTYGTLMRGEKRHSCIANYEHDSSNVSFALMGTVNGKLTTNGNFPGLNQKYEETTQGDFLRFSNIAEVLVTTDPIEGFDGFGANNNFFRRTIAEVNTNGNKPELAWIYVHEADLGFDMKLNDWRAYNGIRSDICWGLIETYGQYDPSFIGKLDSSKFNFHHTKDDR